MSQRSHALNIVIYATLGLILCCSARAQDNTPSHKTGILKERWQAKIWPKNKKFIEIKIDTSQFDDFTGVTNVRARVTFFNPKRKVIGHTEYQFTDDLCQALIRRKPRSPYIRYFQHSFDSATYAVGEILNYESFTIGSSAGAIAAIVPRTDLLSRILRLFGKRRYKYIWKIAVLIYPKILINGRETYIDEEGVLIIGQQPPTTLSAR